ncbi:MAG: UDP-N-acetylmuramoyl-L-alanyl-D-glutamate--2,6-diaminopimelate ligase [Rubrivivax sp.]|nr:UDP-N-acetylmuramoyl-L-alanyl-D-glutamate--2,6-diaminopimelate ligase [Rubrivivax sp.]
MSAGLHHLPDATAAVAWLRARLRGSGTLRTDSRQVQPGDAFIAWPGQAQDGRRFVVDVLRAGAAACLVEAEGAQAFDFGTAGAAVAAVPGLKSACGAIADAWFGHPGHALKVVAITGTNGKTSSAWWTAAALRALGVRAGVIGTLGVGEPPQVQATGLTTPDPVTLHRTLRELADAGCGACAIEASSIGIVEERLAALHIDTAVFTNFTRDHLDYHGSMEAYWAAKRRLFAWPGLRAAVINVDDAHGAALAAELHGTPLDLWTVATRPGARLAAVQVRHEPRGLAFEVLEPGAAGGPGPAGEVRVALASTLVGDYNASNLLGVLGVLRALGQPLGVAARALATVAPVPGRMQRVAGREVEVVVDYAHTPDALDKVLAALRPLARARGGRLVCVFGCGGDRDATKRPLMGAIAARGADRVVITSDNPRSEAPATILQQIRAGIAAAAPEVVLVEDRREAIDQAVRDAAAGDVVLLAGKGHEDYQEIAGVRRPFSDLDEARAALQRRADVGAAAPQVGPASTPTLPPAARPPHPPQGAAA